MILDLKKMKFEGKETETFFFEYSPLRELSDYPDAEVILPLKVNGEITLTGDHSAVIRGEIFFMVKGECNRCLETTERDFALEFFEEVCENNPDGYSVVSDKFDLSPVIDDTVITSLPTAFLCDENCKGICQGCGANLNLEQCKCKK